MMVHNREEGTIRFVLVIEEDQELRDGMAELLRADGHNVIAARAAEDAVCLAARGRPNLIVASVYRSVGETIAMALETRRNLGCGPGVPIVVFSVDAGEGGSEAELDEKVYLTSPDNFDELREFIQRVMPQ